MNANNFRGDIGDGLSCFGLHRCEATAMRDIRVTRAVCPFGDDGHRWMFALGSLVYAIDSPAVDRQRFTLQQSRMPPASWNRSVLSVLGMAARVVDTFLAVTDQAAIEWYCRLPEKQLPPVETQHPVRRHSNNF
jgi:hypothetical protein